jgi:hypothetical protein
MYELNSLPPCPRVVGQTVPALNTRAHLFVQLSQAIGLSHVNIQCVTRQEQPICLDATVSSRQLHLTVMLTSILNALSCLCFLFAQTGAWETCVISCKPLLVLLRPIFETTEQSQLSFPSARVPKRRQYVHGEPWWRWRPDRVTYDLSMEAMNSCIQACRRCQ